jgi:hypothetical protein
MINRQAFFTPKFTKSLILLGLQKRISHPMPEVIVSLSLDEMKNVTKIPILMDNFHNFTILSLSAGKSEQKF